MNWDWMLTENLDYSNAAAIVLSLIWYPFTLVGVLMVLGWSC